MERHVRKLVTFITESSLERQITRELEALGVPGYTITDARGRGAHGPRRSSWAHSANIRIEVICDAPLAEKLVEFLRDHYATSTTALVLYVHDVEVMRPEKFS